MGTLFVWVSKKIQIVGVAGKTGEKHEQKGGFSMTTHRTPPNISTFAELGGAHSEEFIHLSTFAHRPALVVTNTRTFTIGNSNLSSNLPYAHTRTYTPGKKPILIDNNPYLWANIDCIQFSEALVGAQPYGESKNRIKTLRSRLLTFIIHQGHNSRSHRSVFPHLTGIVVETEDLGRSFFKDSNECRRNLMKFGMG
ncbi:unnamed protein product, partial [Nesidiocoris tenuis]